MSFTADLRGLPEALRQIQTIGKRDAEVAAVRTLNRLAFDIRQAWSDEAGRVFDRPVPLTQRAVLYTKASLGKPEATIFIRDEAFKGTPPAKYLSPQVRGGERRLKRFERALQAAGVMPRGSYAMPGEGAKLNAYGNMSAGQITRILSAVRASPDPLQNAPAGKAKRRKRSAGIFAVGGGNPRTAHLKPGVYERAAGRVKPLLIFTGEPRYTRRYEVFEVAQRYLDTHLVPTYSRELERAIRETLARG